MRLFLRLFVCFLISLLALPLWAAPDSVQPLAAVTLETAPAPADNPLKGFMPYEGVYDFPHSLEWFYLPLKDLQKDYEVFDWQPLEKKLDAVAGRGHQAVFRIYLDYPQLPYGVPAFLNHVPKRAYNEHGNGEKLNSASFAPDYEHPDLRRALESFIVALGQRYDGDARIGFLTVGLLGFWGEWHTYPHIQGEDNFMASPLVQNEVLDTFAKAFRKTKLLLREPKENIGVQERAIGFHDDSFAYQTLAPVPWHFWPKIEKFGLAERWKTQPIGGEVRPDIQKCLWNDEKEPCVPPGQEFDLCVQTTHASWLLNQGVFGLLTPAQKQRALSGARRLGYELSVRSVGLHRQDRALLVELSLANLGVAPFYYDWPVELCIVDKQKQIIARWTTDWQLPGVLPQSPQIWKFTCREAAKAPLQKGRYQLLLRAVNPLPNGKVLRFANKTQDETLPGWLTLTPFVLDN
jgi:hypothetical protein